MILKKNILILLLIIGFKRLFGEEPNKDLLLDFLNELLREEQGKYKRI